VRGSISFSSLSFITPTPSTFPPLALPFSFMYHRKKVSRLRIVISLRPAFSKSQPTKWVTSTQLCLLFFNRVYSFTTARSTRGKAVEAILCSLPHRLPQGVTISGRSRWAFEASRPGAQSTNRLWTACNTYTTKHRKCVYNERERDRFEERAQRGVFSVFFFLENRQKQNETRKKDYYLVPCND